jgi:hypothetical protein
MPYQRRVGCFYLVCGGIVGWSIAILIAAWLGWL